MRVYSAAGQTRPALIVVSAMAALLNINSKAPILVVESRVLNFKKNKVLRQVNPAAVRGVVLANVSDTVYPPPCPLEFRCFGLPH